LRKSFVDAGSKKETSIGNAFERLLNDYCKPRNYLLVPELDFKTKFNTTVFPDGFVDYERPEVRDFRAAIAKFKEDIPSILNKLRETI
jgi:hypothetical protein